MKFFFDAGDIFGVILVSDYKVFFGFKRKYLFKRKKPMLGIVELFGVEAFSS